MVSSTKRVCLIGANGTVGSAILSKLIDASYFSVSVLRRSTSTSTPAQAHALISNLTVSPAFDIDELVLKLKDQDAVIAAFPISDVGQHLRLAEAAARAGVSRFVPADFGSCDPSDLLAQECADIYKHKMRIRERCDELSARFATFSWSSLICGHLFDKDLREGYMRFHLDTCEAEIFDGGNMKMSSSTLAQIGQAVVNILRDHLVETHNRALFIHSFNPTQLEILASLERVTGQTWRTRGVNSNVYLEQQRRELNDGNEAALEEVIFVLGIRNADWSLKEGFANHFLGLENESLDGVIATVVAEHKNERM